MNISEAIENAIAREMRRDDRIFYMATAGALKLEAEFGSERARRTPIAESAFTGMAVGAALSGYRPIVHLSNTTFAFSAFDQLINQAAKATYMFGGQAKVPALFIAGFLNGTRRAAQHSQSAYSMYAHAGGLKVITPSTPSNAESLISSAIRSDDPVVCIYSGGHEVASTGYKEIIQRYEDDIQAVPLGVASVERPGTDVTVVGILNGFHLAMEAAERVAAEGISVEVIDPRSLVPFDVQAVRESVRKTGCLVVVDESFPTCSMAAEIATLVAEDAETFAKLRAPVARVCTKSAPVPFNAHLEDYVLPGADDVVSTVRAVHAGHK